MLKWRIICDKNECYPCRYILTIFLESVSWSNTHRPSFPELVYVAMSDQPGQPTNDGENGEQNIFKGDHQSDFQSTTSSLDDLQESRQNKEMLTCDEFKPLNSTNGTCPWVDCAEQVDFILITMYLLPIVLAMTGALYIVMSLNVLVLKIKMQCAQPKVIS